MSAEKDKVTLAKQALMQALGEDNWIKYLSNMKLWFRQRYTKNEFDLVCRKLLSPNQVHLHNQFLLAILNKIDVLAPPPPEMEPPPAKSGTSSSSSSKKRKRTEKIIFETPDLRDFVPAEDNIDHTPANTSTPPIRYAAQELFLPDSGLIMGRLLVAAWEQGLAGIDESAVDLIATGVQVLLKNILSAVLMKKKNYRATTDGKYFYDVGHPISNPFVRNTVSRRKIDDEPLELDKEISSVSLPRRVTDDSVFLSACEEVFPVQRRRITAADVYKTLLDKNIIPSHSIYSINVEKISSRLN